MRLRLMTSGAEDGVPRLLEPSGRLADLCSTLCPAIDVNLSVCEDGVARQVIAANDWKVMDPAALLTRMDVLSHNSKPDELETFRKRAAPNLRVLQDDDGEVFGRACISAGFAADFERDADLHGVVTIGGLQACSLSGIIGILIGKPLRASRDSAMPLVPEGVLRRWAEEQVELVPRVWSSPNQQSACAQYIRLCGGDTKSLPIAIYRGKWVSADDIAAMSSPPDEAILVDHLTIEYDFGALASYTLEDNVFVTRASGIPGLLGSSSWVAPHDDDAWPRGINTDFVEGYGHTFVTLGGAVVEALAAAWAVPISDVLATNDFDRESDVVIAKEGDREIRGRAVRVTKTGTK